jgi:tripartite-type tricarboxylate transporter receptor subunit TctC
MVRAAVVLFALASAAFAQAPPYPSKPIRLVVPFAPGGTSEIIARAIGAEMGKSTGQGILVENKPGGAGNVAMQEVARSAPDGYTLIIGHVGTLAVNPFVFKALPFDTNADFQPVSLITKVPNLFVVNAGVPARDLREFVKLAKDKPGNLRYGSAGNGSAGHLAFEYLKLVAGIEVGHVPYKGTGPMLPDLLAGRTDATSAGTPALLPHIKSGKLRVIAIGMPQRIPALPDAPTVAEQGYPGFETSQWYGIIAPSKVPEPIIRRLYEEVAKAVKTPSVQERFVNDSAIAVGDTPAQFGAFIKEEQARWSKVVRQAKISFD